MPRSMNAGRWLCAFALLALFVLPGCAGFGMTWIRVRDAGVTLVVVDHDMTFLLPLAERIIVMNSGRVIVEGTTEEVQQDQRVIEAYLGEKYARAHALEGAAGQG